MPESLPGLDATLLHEALSENVEEEVSNTSNFEDALLAPDGFVGWVWDGAEVLVDDGFMAAYTDGACFNNQDPHFRRAGVG
eukprot:12016069-Karenia_brevis.AAC.1